MIRSVIRERIKESLLAGNTVTEVAKEFGMLRPTVAYIAKQLDNEPLTEDKEVLNAQVQLERKNQRLQDTNRIERKVFRESAREFNASEDLFKAVLEKIGEVEDKDPTTIPIATTPERVGVIQLSDLHFGEVIDLPKNKFNLEIAKNRVMRHFWLSKELFNSLNIKNVKVLLTGDILNSDRRIDERLTNAASRAESLIHAFNSIKSCLVDLSNEFNILEVVSVIGNESRIDFDLSSIDKTAVNNFDYILHEMLRASLPNVLFSEFTTNNTLERVVDIGEVKVLASHGVYNAKKPEDAVIRAKLDFDCDYFLCGHVHSCLITSKFRRSGGLPASNSYSYHQLGILEHISSQNVHWAENGKLRTLENVLN